MRLRALALAAASAVVLSACGGNSTDGRPADTAGTAAADAKEAGGAAGTGTADAPTGPELAEAAVDALEEADAVRIAGTLEVDGQRTEVDLRLRGAEVAGSMTLQGHEVQVILADGTFFMQAPSELWADQGVPQGFATGLGGTWVLVPTGAEGLGGLSVSALVGQLRSPGATVADDVTATDLDGQPVWELRDSTGTVLHVAAEGEPYPVRMTRTGVGGGVLRLSEFGTVPPVEPPADHLDLGDLTG